MKIVGKFEPKVNLISMSVPTKAWGSTDEYGNQEMHDWGRVIELYREAGGIDEINDVYPDQSPAPVAVAGGRLCYNAWGRKNASTADNTDYIHNILRQNHWSVLEHNSFSFLIEDVPRYLTHELVRHRHFSFSQESQRYVKVSKEAAEVIISPLVSDGLDATELEFIGRGVDHPLTNGYKQDLALYHQTYKEMRDAGHNHKTAAGEARRHLPESLSTKILVTGNARTWAEFLSKRDAPAAEATIRQLAGIIGDQLADVFPEVFGPEGRAIWDHNNEQKDARH